MEDHNSVVQNYSEIYNERLTTDEKLLLLRAQEQFLLCQIAEEDSKLKLFTSEIESFESAIDSQKTSLLLNYELLIHHKESCISSFLQNALISKERLHLEMMEHNFLASFKVDHSTYHNQLICKECKNYPKPCKYC